MPLFIFFVCIHRFEVWSLQVRSIDPHIITYMDEYAMLLKIKSDDLKLNKLVYDLVRIDPTRPEVFVALSVAWEKKDERGALTYADKVSLPIWNLVDCFPSLIIYLTILPIKKKKKKSHNPIFATRVSKLTRGIYQVIS